MGTRTLLSGRLRRIHIIRGLGGMRCAAHSRRNAAVDCAHFTNSARIRCTDRECRGVLSGYPLRIVWNQGRELENFREQGSRCVRLHREEKQQLRRNGGEASDPTDGLEWKR